MWVYVQRYIIPQVVTVPSFSPRSGMGSVSWFLAALCQSFALQHHHKQLMRFYICITTHPHVSLHTVRMMMVMWFLCMFLAAHVHLGFTGIGEGQPAGLPGVCRGSSQLPSMLWASCAKLPYTMALDPPLTWGFLSAPVMTRRAGRTCATTSAATCSRIAYDSNSSAWRLDANRASAVYRTTQHDMLCSEDQYGSAMNLGAATHWTG
jgi:hypothetical protein